MQQPTAFSRYYTYFFCAALWAVTLWCVFAGIGREGDARGAVIFFGVLAASGALGTTALIVAVERRVRANGRRDDNSATS